MSPSRKKKNKVLSVGIIDADLLGRDKHRFPNLVCEKISGYWKDHGANTTLLLDYNQVHLYDEVYISKVFTDTPVPEWVLDFDNLPQNVHIGGTGFFFDKAPNLDPEIEHHMPDYHLYDSWVNSEIDRAIANSAGNDKFSLESFKNQFKEYTDYSIGFLTRGCFRKCGFCVNKKYDHVFPSSPLSEFYDPSRKKLCFLDDNFFGCPNWKQLLQEVIDTGKPYKFKQGLDERLLTQEKCDMLFNSKYDGDFTFAFDNIQDYDLIHSKLKLIRESIGNSKKSVKFYVLVGYESTDEKDIENAFRRIELLMMYKCLPYVMRYQNKNETPWKESKYKGLYITLARWANQPSIFKKMSFRQFCQANQALHKTKGGLCTAMRSLVQFEKEFPEIAERYFDMRFDELSKGNYGKM